MSTIYPDAFYQVSSQLPSGEEANSIFKIAAMAAILDF